MNTAPSDTPFIDAMRAANPFPEYWRDAYNANPHDVWNVWFRALIDQVGRTPRPRGWRPGDPFPGLLRGAALDASVRDYFVRQNKAAYKAEHAAAVAVSRRRRAARAAWLARPWVEPRWRHRAIVHLHHDCDEDRRASRYRDDNDRVRALLLPDQRFDDIVRAAEDGPPREYPERAPTFAAR